MEDKKHFEYVISGCSLLSIFKDTESKYFDEYKFIIKKMTDTLIKKINDDSYKTSGSVSLLYNGYTESNNPKKLEELDNLNVKNIYSDSGGLQIVTAGKNITPELRQKIYKSQTYADYAMCFDEIPLTSTSLVRSKNERSNIENKIFHHEKLLEFSLKTGNNIKEQVKYFQENNAKTKIIIIVQGNTSDDMVEYYKGIQSCLLETDYDNIGGLAVADTCMGNGDLETIEMLIAAKKISLFCHENVKKHLHILGVGSKKRILPLVYLTKSKFLDSFKHISYDSTSHSSCLMNGLLKLNGTCIKIGVHKSYNIEQHFRKIYQFFSSVYSEYLTEDEYIQILFSNNSDTWKYNEINENIIKSKYSNEIISIILLFSLAYTYYQVHNFSVNIDKMYFDEFDTFTKHPLIKDIMLNKLLNIKTLDDISEWMHQSKNIISSKRIKRASGFATFEGLF